MKEIIEMKMQKISAGNKKTSTPVTVMRLCLASNRKTNIKKLYES